jgi:hypothetical protein
VINPGNNREKAFKEMHENVDDKLIIKETFVD